MGQIAYVPPGWTRVVTNGPGALTENQCLRMNDRYIYAAQFHIEMAGTPETSRKIMSNFLRLAHEWGGYNPQGRPIPGPICYEQRTIEGWSVNIRHELLDHDASGTERCA